MKLKIRILFAGLILLSTTIYAMQESVEEQPTTKALLFKWKPSTDEYSKLKMTQLFTSLANEVSGFEELEIREIKSDRFDVAFFLTFSSRKAMEDYKSHELHNQIVDLGSVIIEDFLEFEYALSAK